MYPGFIPHWRRQRCGESRAETGYSRGGHRTRYSEWEYRVAGDDEAAQFGFAGGAFGVRRPLRYLAYKLQLEDAQVGELARILDEIKTERAQAAVDHRRALSAFADAIEGEAFDRTKADAGAALRLQSAERLRSAFVKALERLHELLDREQRTRLAYLIRMGTLSI